MAAPSRDKATIDLPSRVPSITPRNFPFAANGRLGDYLPTILGKVPVRQTRNEEFQLLESGDFKSVSRLDTNLTPKGGPQYGLTIHNHNCQPNDFIISFIVHSVVSVGISVPKAVRATPVEDLTPIRITFEVTYV